MPRASPRTIASWCADGVLQGYVLGSYSARKLGLKSTGNAGGIHNLLVTAADAAGAGHGGSFEQLLQRMGEGLLVTELMGPGVNGVTGDYSRGASGFWVERGELAFPVHEVTVADNLRNMLRGIVAVGSDVDAQGAIRTGSILVDAMTIAGDEQPAPGGWRRYGCVSRSASVNVRNCGSQPASNAAHSASTGAGVAAALRVTPLR